MTQEDIQNLADQMLAISKGEYQSGKKEISDEVRTHFTTLMRMAIDLGAHHSTDSTAAAMDRIRQVYDSYFTSNHSGVNDYLRDRFGAVALYSYFYLTHRLLTENLKILLEGDVLPQFIDRANLDAALDQIKFISENEEEELEKEKAAREATEKAFTGNPFGLN